jgi:hypothetical protein
VISDELFTRLPISRLEQIPHLFPVSSLREKENGKGANLTAHPFRNPKQYTQDIMLRVLIVYRWS